MRIDCHCHVFNNDCIPVPGLLQSRFGITVGSSRSWAASRTGKKAAYFRLRRRCLAVFFLILRHSAVP